MTLDVDQCGLRYSRFQAYIGGPLRASGLPPFLQELQDRRLARCARQWLYAWDDPHAILQDGLLDDFQRTNGGSAHLEHTTEQVLSSTR